MAKILVLAKSGFGKALKNGTRVFTKSGWKPIETLTVGELVGNSDGDFSSIVGVYPQEGLHTVYNVSFNDGSIIPCNESHLWEIWECKSGKKQMRVVTTKELYDLKLDNRLTITYNREKNGHPYKEHKYKDVRMIKPINFGNNPSYDMDPYTLGVLLGDGCFQDSISVTLNTSNKSDIIDKLQVFEGTEWRIKVQKGNAVTYNCSKVSTNPHDKNPLKEVLAKLGLDGLKSTEKFIPEDYFYGTVSQRHSLLQGLLDTDGYNVSNTLVEYSTSSERLANDVVRLCRELGLHVQIKDRVPSYTYNGDKKEGQISFRLYINFRRVWKHIIDVEKTVEIASMTCIEVDSPDSLYITEGYTLTHNTTSYAGREKYGIKGLDPKTTFVVQCIGRGVPNPDFKLAPEPEIKYIAQYNRVQVDTITGLDRFKKVAEFIESFKNPNNPYKNLIVDDFNYLSQDFYMANAMKGGWDTPKQIGYGMGLIFNAMKGCPENKNIICCAHYEEYKDKNGDSISYKFKTTGKMVDDYITPEGNFDIILFGKQSFDMQSKKATKTFLKEFDGEFPAKDSLGYLDDMPDEFPNDLGLVVAEIAKRFQ